MRTTTPALVLFFSIVPVAAGAETAMTVGPSKAAGKNMLWNGTFDSETLRPWNVGLDSSETGRAAVTNHELCVQIERPGPSAASVVIRQRPLALARGHHYQLRFAAHASKATRLRVRLSRDQRALHRAVGGDGRGGARRPRLRGDVRRLRRRGERRAGDRSGRRAGGRRAADRLPRRRRAQRSAGGAAGRTPEPPGASQGARQPGRLSSGAAQGRDGRDGRDGCDGRGCSCRLAAGRRPRPRARQREDPPVRRRPLLGRAGPADRFLVGDRDWRGVQAARRQRGERAVRHRCRRLPPVEVRRAGVLLSAAERHPDQDAVRRLARLRARGRPPRRQERRLRAGESLHLFARRQRRLVRRRRSRQVRRQRRVLRLAPAERIRDPLALRHDGGRVRRREDEDPRVEERAPRSARRGTLGARSLLAVAGAGGTADGRDGSSEGPRRQVVQHSDLAGARRHQALPAPRQHRRDLESGGGGRAGGAAVAKARIPPSRRAASRPRRPPSPPPSATPPYTPSPTPRAAAPTAMASWTTSSTGPRPSSSSPPGSPSTAASSSSRAFMRRKRAPR